MLQVVSRVGLSLCRQAVRKSPIIIPQNFTARFQCRSYSSPIFDVETAEDFEEKVINSPAPVIVDFHADWCGPCQSLGPRLEEKVLSRGGDVLLAKINVDAAAELAMDYRVTAVPTVIAFKNGVPGGSFQGLIDDEQLDAFIESAIDEEND